MDQVINVDSEAFRAEWEPAWNRVFGLATNLLDIFPAACPFGPKWNVVALPYNFHEGDNLVINWNPDAEKERYEDRTILFDTLNELGIHKIMWTTYRISEAPEFWVLPPACNAVWDVYQRSFEIRGWEYSTVFSRDASWGLISSPEDLSLLGGTPEFMAVYLKKAGGMEAVKARFQFDDVIRGGWPSVLRNVTQDRIDRFYAMLGWEPPDYEEGWRRLGLAKWP